jgi:hypothetical protein
MAVNFLNEVLFFSCVFATVIGIVLAAVALLVT